jgi:hypothetical protein
MNHGAGQPLFAWAGNRPEADMSPSDHESDAHRTILKYGKDSTAFAIRCSARKLRLRMAHDVVHTPHHAYVDAVGDCPVRR